MVWLAKIVRPTEAENTINRPLSLLERLAVELIVVWHYLLIAFRLYNAIRFMCLSEFLANWNINFCNMHATTIAYLLYLVSASSCPRSTAIDGMSMCWLSWPRPMNRSANWTNSNLVMFSVWWARTSAVAVDPKCAMECRHSDDDGAYDAVLRDAMNLSATNWNCRWTQIRRDDIACAEYQLFDTHTGRFDCRGDYPTVSFVCCKWCDSMCAATRYSAADLHVAIAVFLVQVVWCSRTWAPATEAAAPSTNARPANWCWAASGDCWNLNCCDHDRCREWRATLQSPCISWCSLSWIVSSWSHTGRDWRTSSEAAQKLNARIGRVQ